ncbi:hypothetical protein C0583_01160 [Candidatus Parcubacteria bacterium]|nr:MAG: hypothetical protein C0583_01160 [Candidatus Parcubacteria bacterium]
MNKFLKTIILVVLVVIFLLIDFVLLMKYLDDSKYVIINNKKIRVEIVNTEESRRLGLSGRDDLSSNSGMLFLMDKVTIGNFWMKNMNFPLYIIWINDDTVVKVSPDLAPEGNNPENTYSSDSPINVVLEVNAGFAEEYDIKAGDKVEYKFNLE